MKRFLATLLCAALIATGVTTPISSAFTPNEKLVHTIDTPEGANYFPVQTFIGFQENGRVDANLYELTQQAKSTATADVTMGEHTGDNLYFGFDQPFDGIAAEVSSMASGGSYSVEYWNGNTWTAIMTNTPANVANIAWTRPNNWQKTTLEGSQNLFFVRLHTNNPYNSASKLDQVGLTVYNLVYEMEDELGNELVDIHTSLDGGSDNHIYSVKADGNLHYLAVCPGENTDTYAYAAGSPGYIAQHGQVTVGRAQEHVNLSMQYSHVITGQDANGKQIAIESVSTDGYAYKYRIVNGVAYCAVPFDQDGKTTKIIPASDKYAEAYIYLDNRADQFSAQEKQTASFRSIPQSEPTPEPEIVTIHEPDLYVGSIYFDKDDGEDVIFTIGNKGKADVPANTDVEVAIHIDGKLAWNVTLHNNNSNSMLRAGNESTFNAGVLINTAGSHDIEVSIDTDNAVQESNESNNKKEVSLTLRPLADDKDKNLNCKSPFDDIRGHWAEDAICELWKMDVVDGRDHDDFNPNDEITRAEFLKMALLAADYDVNEMDSGDIFSDVSEDDWFYEYVTYAAFKGYVHGYDDGTFQPNDEITRAEALVLIMRIADEELWDFNDRDINFDDVDEDDWFAYAVVIADREGIIQGDRHNDDFDPNDDLTRAESAVMVRRAWYAFYR